MNRCDQTLVWPTCYHPGCWLDTLERRQRHERGMFDTSPVVRPALLAEPCRAMIALASRGRTRTLPRRWTTEGCRTSGQTTDNTNVDVPARSAPTRRSRWCVGGPSKMPVGLDHLSGRSKGRLVTASRLLTSLVLAAALLSVCPLLMAHEAHECESSGDLCPLCVAGSGGWAPPPDVHYQVPDPPVSWPDTVVLLTHAQRAECVEAHAPRGPPSRPLPSHLHWVT